MRVFRSQTSRHITVTLLAIAAGAATLNGCSASSPRIPPLPEPPAVVRTTGDELYELSPARVHIRRLGPQSMRMLAPHWSRVREGDRQTVQATLIAMLSEDRVAPFVRVRLKEAADANPAMAAAAIEWLKSPIGYEVKFAEATAWTGEKSPEDTFYANVAQVRDNSTPEIRMEPIRRLAAATGALEKTLDMTEAVGTVVARLVNATRAGAAALPVAVLESEISRERHQPAVVLAYAPVVEAALLVRCRELDLAQLDSFIAFSSTGAGRWYHETLSSALVGAVRSASTDVEGIFEAASRSGATKAARPAFDLDSLLVPLPSGRSVRLLALAQTAPDGEPAVVLRYETMLALQDATAIRNEAQEVWQRLRSQIEDEGAQAVILQATGSVDGWVFPFASSRKYGWKRGNGGQWAAMQERRLGTLERELLWSVPP